jgi:hypothetical protein
MSPSATPVLSTVQNIITVAKPVDSPVDCLEDYSYWIWGCNARGGKYEEQILLEASEQFTGTIVVGRDFLTLET